MPATFILLALAMIAFAANSVFARLALGAAHLDAAGYSGVRLIAGAVMLALLLIARNGAGELAATIRRRAKWSAAAALFGYMIGFSYAYTLLATGTGALILFASVQISMLAWALIKGDRPPALALAGMAVALGASVYLVSPGITAPDPLGAALMVAAGLSWAAYTLIGRGSTEPLADTASAFVLNAPVAVLLGLVSLGYGHHDMPGLIYAIASGAIASGIGYAIWYAVLPKLSRSTAAIVQLSVPLIAAAGGIVFLGEGLTWRLTISGALILGGLGMTIVANTRRIS